MHGGDVRVDMVLMVVVLKNRILLGVVQVTCAGVGVL